MKSVSDEANKLGLKYVAAESSLYAAAAMIALKKYDDAKLSLQDVLLQADKLGALALKAQGHALMARAFRLQGKASEADREKGIADQLLGDLQSEGHFDLKARYDFASVMQ
jgi:hypothetical protein